jgi:hypothetical protein
MKIRYRGLVPCLAVHVKALRRAVAGLRAALRGNGCSICTSSIRPGTGHLPCNMIPLRRRERRSCGPPSTRRVPQSKPNNAQRDLGPLTLCSATLPLHFVFGFRRGLSLPLEIRNRVWPAAGQRLDVILHPAGAGTARSASRRTWVLALELISDSM